MSKWDVHPLKIVSRWRDSQDRITYICQTGGEFFLNPADREPEAGQGGGYNIF